MDNPDQKREKLKGIKYMYADLLIELKSLGHKMGFKSIDMEAPSLLLYLFEEYCRICE